MTRRLERINNLIRNTIGELLLSKMSDPRIDPALVSVTHVQTADDLLSAKVFVSVLGEEKKQKLTLEALRHASGHIQELMMRQIQLRSTPILRFELDTKFKETLKTLEILQKVSEEIRMKEQAQAATGEQASQDAQGGDEVENDEKETA